jgi:hypothetical protein
MWNNSRYWIIPPGSALPLRVQGDESEEHIAGRLWSRSTLKLEDEHPDAQTYHRIEGEERQRQGESQRCSRSNSYSSPIAGEAMSGPEHEPHLIETIDKQQSFKMFNEGWILPPDQKRGGRVRVERPPPLPPKKKKSRVYHRLLLRVLLTCYQLLDRPSSIEVSPTPTGGSAYPTSN